MVYLKSLHLKDFLTHKDTTIELSPFFNCIVGPTRTGKSSIVRALGFLFYNDWYEDYVRFGAKFVVITATFSNNVVMIRTKGKGINRILLKTAEGEKRYEAFGFELPQEVQELIGIFPIEYGAKDPIQANVAHQDDEQFLLHARGPERTKVLSRLSGLHWIDYALKDLNKDRRTISGNVQDLQATNIDLKGKIDNFTKLDGFDATLKKERKRIEQLTKSEEFCEKGDNLLARISKWKDEYKYVQDLKSIDFKTSIASLEHIIYLNTDVLQELQTLQRKISSAESSITNLDKHIDTLTEESKVVQHQLEEEIKNNPDCPICGSIMESEHLLETK